MASIGYYFLMSAGERDERIDLIEGETVREFSLRLLKKIGRTHDGITSPCIFVSKLPLSWPEDKNKLVVDFFDVKRGIFINPLLNSNHWARNRGNLKADDFEPDVKTCPICLVDYEIGDCSPEGLMIDLSCGHRFHAKCLLHTISRSEFENLRCPTCRRGLIIRDLDRLFDMVF